MPLRSRIEPSRRRRARAPRRVHAVVLAGIAAVALALAAGVASANTLSVSEDDFAIAFPELTFSGGGSTIICGLTLSGSFHERAISKINGSQIADITSASVDTCQGDGGATVLTETLPWSLAYAGFFEELPEIEGINVRLIGLSLFISDGIACLWGTSTAEPAGGIVNLNAEGQVTSLSADPNFEIDLEDEDFLCALAGDSSFSGSASMTDGSAEALFVTLGESPPTAGNLTASPTAVAIEALESSDTFTLRNTGGSTATIDSVEDESATQFDVSGCGEGRGIGVEGSCVYTIEVDERPLPSGRVTITYDDGQEGTRRVSVEVDIAGGGDEARLVASPTAVTIEALEQSGIVAIRNDGGGDTATIDNVTVVTTDSESPEFTVTTSACRRTLANDETCHYLISVDSRPERAGSITVEYDDGAGGDRRLVIEVDVAGPDPAELEADPTEVVIETLESNDSFVIRNISPDTAAVVNRAILRSDDAEEPEFSVAGIGCPEIYVAGASCTYVVSVNSRPEADGTYTIEYDDGAGEDREVIVRVDIES